MKDYCDLHVHSYYSDGTLSPSELIEGAKKIELGAIALTDHNTTKGIKEFLKAANSANIWGIAGIEISTEFLNKEVHILGLFLPQDKLDEVEAFVKILTKRKRIANLELLQRLKAGGYKIDLKELKKSTKGNFNRAHVAAQMVKRGYIDSIYQAFEGVLSPEAGFYVPPKRIDSLEAVEFLNKIGAVSVIAHPLLNLNTGELRRLIRGAKPLGLCGMETLYSTYNEKTTQRSIDIAKEFSLMQSGGSDFHGSNKPDISLGIGRGNLKIPKNFADALCLQADKNKGLKN